MEKIEARETLIPASAIVTIGDEDGIHVEDANAIRIGVQVTAFDGDPTDIKLILDAITNDGLIAHRLTTDGLAVGIAGPPATLLGLYDITGVEVLLVRVENADAVNDAAEVFVSVCF